MMRALVLCSLVIHQLSSAAAVVQILKVFAYSTVIATACQTCEFIDSAASIIPDSSVHVHTSVVMIS